MNLFLKKRTFFEFPALFSCCPRSPSMDHNLDHRRRYRRDRDHRDFEIDFRQL